MNDQKKDSIDRLAAAYEAMLQRVHEAAETAEEKSVPWLRETLANVREHAVELGELTREEADKVSRYVERDLQDAAGFIAETGEEVRDWLSSDWQLMQARMLDMFAGMADQTSQALKEFAEQARTAGRYQTGEITAPGILGCVACGAELRLKKTGPIPPCLKCQATTFERKPGVAPH